MVLAVVGANTIKKQRGLFSRSIQAHSNVCTHHKTLFSTSTAVSISPPPSFRYNNNKIFLPFSLENQSSPLVQSQSRDNNTPATIPLDAYEQLVRKYQHSCISIDAQKFHLEVLKRGVYPDLFVCNTLVNVYARIADLVSARKLFDEMPDRNVVSWACLISCYSRNGKPEQAFGVFRCMMSEGVLPSCFVFVGLLRACKEEPVVCGVKLGMQLHGMSLKFPFADEALLGNVLISMYGSCLGYVDYAHRVFDEIKVKNLISWNSVISVYSQIGNAFAAFKLFSNMEGEDTWSKCWPNEYTFGSLISAASSSLCGFNVFLLEQVLARVEKCGFLPDLYVGSAFVSGFSRFGLFDRARKILGQMSIKNVVSMNGLMIGLVRQRKGEEATQVFMEMRNWVDINHDSYVVLLSALAEFSVLEEGIRKGQEVHGYIVRNGLCDVTVAIGNGLINMYAKCNAISDARTVFKLMNDKDSVTWNSMISGFDQNKCCEESLQSYHAMRRTGLVPSNFTLISSLSSCASMSWIKLGEQIHGEGLKLGLDLDVSVSNSLLALYAETGCLDKCQKVFSWMQEYDQVSWNTMIGAFADPETSDSASIQFFLNMMRAGWIPNRVSFINVLSTVSSLNLSKLNHQVHPLILKYNIINDGAIENALLACYGKCGEMDDCEKIFSRMSERRDEVSWNSMIAGYIHNEDLNEAMNLVWFMMQRGQRLDCFTFATVLSACASVATLGRGMEVHACAVRASLESDVVIGSALVDMYSKCGRIDYASRFFSLMPVRNVYSWNSMISGYARHGHGEKALELFSQMKLNGQLPDHVTFVGVLSACSHFGLVDEGFEHFRSLTKDYGLTPRIEHYSCMVDLLGRASELDKIEKFISAMPMKPNVLIWRTVLGACCRANGRKIELGKKAAEELMDMEPENAVNYVLLSNMYASGENWEGMAKTRRAMRAAAVKKEVGCSWVTMKDGVHVFVAGDKSHPENDLIYEKINEIYRKIMDAGYVPQTRFAMYDLEQENKEELLRYHSEKLAVAFVLTRNSELPIRIMKNLRVCGDCHSFFKYVSKIVNRPIVLRDSNRFHHFQDGKCSCGDYW